MEDIAPQITRQRLLIEANYNIEVTEKTIKDYLLQLAGTLNLRIYGEPVIHSPSGEGKDINQGFDAFVSLIDSGIALYIWTNEKFLSCVIYTCKSFSYEEATKFTEKFFNTSKLVFKEF